MNSNIIRNTKVVSGCLNLFSGSLLMSSIIVVLFLSFSQEIKAQQDFINGFYMFNPLAFNPAITGVDDQIVVSGIARKQWTGINGAPNTQYLNAHLPIISWFDRFDRPGRIDYPTGLSGGLLLLNDKIGATRYSRFSIPVATRIRLSRSGIRLSLGLRADGSQFTSDIDGLRQYGGDMNTLSSRYFFDFAAGIYCYHKQWYGGISMTNIRGINMEEYGYDVVPHYFATGGYAYPLNKDLVLRMTTLLTLVESAPLSITVTPAVIINSNIETGLTYRYDDMVGAFIAYTPFHQFKIGYWYEYPVGVKMNQIGSTHEIVFQMSFERFKKRVVSPRYFW